MMSDGGAFLRRLSVLALFSLFGAPALADIDGQCYRSLSLDGQLASGADPDAVAKACLAAAETSDAPLPQYMAGLIYEFGIGEAVDSMKAKNRYRSAANKGHAEAQLAMGRLSEKTRTFDWALAWYARAAMNRNAAAQTALLRLKAAEPGEMWRAAVSAIAIDDSQGGLGDIAGSGSGIVVSENIVLTNEHVVERCDRMSVAPGIPAKVVARDADRDLAVLKTSIRVGEAAEFATEAEIGLEDMLVTGGYPGIGDADPTFVMTEGQRSPRDLGLEAEEFWLLKNQINPGNSGGPLLDASGLVRGVVFASIPVTGIVKKSAPKGGHEGMAIRLDTVKAFLDQHQIAYRVAPKGPVAQAADMENHVAAITVLVNCFQR
jgi:S1-C subfamily serine protease